MSWPKYTSIKYYYTDKTTSDKLEIRDWKKKDKAMCASLVLTNKGQIYMNQANGSIICPDELRGDDHPYDWLPVEGIKFAIECQPYDFNDVWCRGHAMYSKDLWRLVLQDIRDFKIKIIKGEINLKELTWYG